MSEADIVPATTNILEGPHLALRCGEISEISQKVSALVLPYLTPLTKLKLTYTFKDRHKGTNSIHDKVRRKRLEGKENGDRKFIEYNPDHITDAWACRFVTLYQNQIPRIVREILIALEDFNRDISDTNIQLIEFTIYTNRPPNDPLSITNEVLGLLENIKIPSVVEHMDRKNVLRPPENKKSAYSSVHLVCKMPLTMDYADRRHVPDDGKFEIQVRDIFEEGWGEIQHDLLYSRRASENPIFDGEDALKSLWQPHLNALKTFVDGCSQHASIIKQGYEFTKLQRLPSLAESATSREDDKKAIVGKLRKQGLADAAGTVELAYDLLISGADADDMDQAADTFEAAALKFEEAIAQIGTASFGIIRNRKFRTIDYYLKLESANCYYSSHRNSKSKLLKARQYCEELAAKYQVDATVRLRLAQIVLALDESETAFQTAAKLLQECIKQVPHDGLLGQHHWMSLAAPIQLGYCYWCRSKITSTNGSDEFHIENLRLAVSATSEAIAEWDSEPDEIRNDASHSMFVHKAISNKLYYLAFLKFAGEETDTEIRETLKKIKSIHVPHYLEYYKTRDNLMLAHHAIGDETYAAQLAVETWTELHAVAESRARRQLQDGEVESFLTGREKPAFKNAGRIMSGEIFLHM